MAVERLRRIGQRRGIDRDLALDQPADGGEIALHVDAERIAHDAVLDLEHQRALVRQRPAHLLRRRIGPADALDVEIVLLATSTTARCCSCRCRPRRCGRRPRRDPARAASSPAAPGPAGRGSACSRRRRRCRDRRCGTARRPRCRPAPSRPAAAASASSGLTPVPTTTRSATYRSPSLVSSATLPSSCAVDLRHRGRQLELDAVVLVLGEDHRAGFLVAGARHDARRELDHRHLDAELGRRGRGLEPDQAGADHDQMLAAGEPGLDARAHAPRCADSARAACRAAAAAVRASASRWRSPARRRASGPPVVTISCAARSIAVQRVLRFTATPCLASPPGPAIGASSGLALPSSTAFDSGGFS